MVGNATSKTFFSQRYTNQNVGGGTKLLKLLPDVSKKKRRYYYQVLAVFVAVALSFKFMIDIVWKIDFVSFWKFVAAGFKIGYRFLARCQIFFNMFWCAEEIIAWKLFCKVLRPNSNMENLFVVWQKSWIFICTNYNTEMRMVSRDGDQNFFRMQVTKGVLNSSKSVWVWLAQSWQEGLQKAL